MKGQPALAGDTLKVVVAHIDSDKSWLGVFDQPNGRAPEISLTNLQYNYGRILADRGDFANARLYLDKAITASKNNVPGVMRFVRAKVAAAQKDYAVAALDYSEVSQESYDNDVQALIMMQPDLKEKYCRIALDFALKANNLSGDELGKIYIRLADALQSEQGQEKLALYNKAYPLIVNDREKQPLAIKIANLSSQQEFAASSAGAKIAIDHTAEFNMREAAARLAEKTNANYAAQLWLQLATAEVYAKQFDQAIAHSKTAIALVQKQPANLGPGFSEFFGTFSIPLSAFALDGRQEDAKVIGQQMLDKAESLYGKQSFEYRQSLINLFILYAGQNDYKTADKYLDQILAIDPRKYELGRSWTGHSSLLEDIALGFTSKADKRAYGMEVLNKILASLLNTYGADDLHTMNVLIKIGQAETKAGNFAEAEKRLKKAMVIAKLYGTNSGSPFASPLVAAMHELLATEKKTDELKQLQEQIEINRKDEEKNWSIGANATIEATQKYFDYWHSKAPYSHRALDSGIKLLEFSVKQKDWRQVKVLAPECIKMLAHNSPFLVGGCTPHPSPAQRKFYCFKSLIQAYLETGGRQQAFNWLKRAQAEKSYSPLTEELVFLAEIENLCGNKDEALKSAREAEKTLPKNEQWNPYQHSVTELYKKLGSAPDVERTRLQAQAEMLIRYEAQLRTAERERKQKAEEENVSKKLPITVEKAKSEDQKGWIAEPSTGLVFEPVREVRDTYKFGYAALASANLWFGENAYLRQKKSGHHMFQTYSFAGSFDRITCAQPVHKAGKLTFLYDGLKDSLKTKVELQPPTPNHSGSGGTAGPGGPGGGGGALLPNLGIGQHQFTEAPEVMALPFLPALNAPATSTALDSNSLILKAGDYTADKLTIDRLVMPQPGRVRIFVKDNSSRSQKKSIETKKNLAGDYENWNGVSAFATTPGAFVNKSGPWDELQQRSMLEIWYNGTDTINLADGTKFTGIIYAPNATIRLGAGVEFLGAMVGKSIFAGPDTSVMYLPQLRAWAQN